MDNTGNIQWKQCYGGTGNESGYFIQPTVDGGYVVAGSSSSGNYDLTCNAGKMDAWAFKINQSGVIQWQKSFGGNDDDEIRCIQPLNDGSFIAAGNTSSSDIAGYHQPVPGKYIVESTDCWVVKLSAPQPPGITFTAPSGLACTNSLTAIKAEATFAGLNPTYQWSRNGISAGTNSPVYEANFQDNDVVTCTVISGGPSCNNSGLQTTKSITLHTKNIINPSIHITADNNFTCDCATNNFSATVTNGGPSSVFQWQINGQNTGGNSPSFSSNTLHTGDVITCVYSDNSSCVAGGSVISNNIQMNNSSGDASSLKVTASADTICYGTTVNFNADAVNVGTNAVYQWMLNNTNVGNNSPTFASNNLSKGDEVSCLLTITSPCSNISITSNIVGVAINSAAIQITPQDTLINPGGQVQLNTIIGGNISSFQWMPPDKLINPDVLSPTTIPLMDNTVYTLTAKSNDGCISSKSVMVNILRSIFMPDAFTPNGDGKNDVFRIPPAVSLKLKEFSIYNEWGSKVFSTENISKGWDGTISGKPQSTGVYIYIIKGSNNKGSVFLKGSFVLIR